MARKDIAQPNGRIRPARAAGLDRPDPRPARLMVGAGALAAVTIIGAGLVDFPPAVAEEPASAPAPTGVAKVEQVSRPVRYVRLKPGQKAPKGAKVIKEAAPTPRVVVRRVVTPAPSRSARTVARSRQSGG
ncbi:MAG: hypothetical protein PVG27_06105 [Chloroflexota bacterium]|jgi:hypothetical protein